MAKSIEEENTGGNKECIDVTIFQSLFNNSISGILYGNPDNGCVIDANTAAAEIFGYTIEELRKLNRNDIFDFNDPSMIESLKIRQKDGSAKGELIGIKKNGIRFPCEFTSSIFKNEKGENRTSTILNDISDKIANSRLKEFERQKKEALMNSIDALMWSITTDFKLITGNNQFNNSLKESHGVVFKPGDNVLNANYFSADTLAIWKNLYNQVVLGKNVNEEVFNPEYINTPWAWHTINLQPIIENNLIVGISCYSRNITEKKNIELKLKESTDLFEKLTSKIPVALYQFEINLDGKMYFPYISSGVKYINASLDVELLKTDASSAFSTVHPEDLHGLLQSIEFTKNNLTDWEFEYRSVLNDGKIIWSRGKSSPEKRTDGTITWYGYLQDVTEQKKSHEKIRESNERYDIIAKATNDIIWDWDLKTNKIICNKGIIGIFGYNYKQNNTETDINWWFSKIHPQDIIRVRENLELRIANQENRWEDEYRFLCFDGTYKYIHDRVFLVVKNSVPVRIIGAMQDVTERKISEEKLRVSEEQFKTIFEAIPECLKLIGEDGHVIEINQAGLKMLEIESIDKMNKCNLVDFVLPKYKDDFITLTREALAGKRGKFEFEIVGHLGTKRWIETNIIPMLDSSNKINIALAVTRDITKRKIEVQHLKLVESVITNTNDSIMITEAEPFDEPGPKIVFVNEAFTKMTGYRADEVIGKSPRFLQGAKSDKDELKKIGEAIRNWKPYEVIVLNYKKNGESFWNNFSIKPIADEKGWYTHWISVERDVTKQMNNDLEREHMIAELSQNNKDLKQFSHVISHNLRAPIANLLGLTSLIDHYKVTSKTLKQILDGIKQSALMFDDTIKDLTKVLVIKDQTSVIKKNIIFVEVIDKVLKQLSISVNDNAIKINYEFKNAPFISFSESYSESILLNLFTNAIKYKSPKRKLKIDIVSAQVGDFIELKFTDNGIGIDVATHKEKLFKLYQRFHDNPDGKGLGLYLIKSQIEALGGSIDLESEIGKGTTFILKFKNI